MDFQGHIGKPLGQMEVKIWQHGMGETHGGMGRLQHESMWN
jgi:hypothetical protein